jgi:hypothetical protein
MTGNLIRFPIRTISAVLVCKARGSDDEWLAIAGAHGWSFGSLAEARVEAHWLARNTGLPVRELIGRAP